MNKHLKRDAQDVVDNLGDANQRFSGKTVLITGAGGFLGCHFVHYLALLNESGVFDEPVKIVASDNFIRGVPEWMSSIEGNVEIQKRDIIQQKEFGAADFVIHAASIASPMYYRLHPLETMDANIQGLRNLLDYSIAHQFESMLFFSSSEIYGDPDPAHIPTKETYRGYVSCTGPRACYDESKRFGETLCVTFQQVHGTRIKTARPFNNYGPGLKITDRRVIPDFARDILEGRDIVMLSDGTATRTFCYISDAITGYLLALLSDQDGEAFNIGADGPEISMRDLASMLLKISGSDRKVVFQNSEDAHYLTDNPVRRCPDLTKARTILGYSPRIGLEEGLSRTMDYYRDFPTAAEA